MFSGRHPQRTRKACLANWDCLLWISLGLVSVGKTKGAHRANHPWGLPGHGRPRTVVFCFAELFSSCLVYFVPVSFSRRLRNEFQVGSEDKNDCLFVGQRIQWKQDSTFGWYIRRQIMEAFCCLISCLLTFVRYYGSKLFLVACD